MKTKIKVLIAIVTLTITSVTAQKEFKGVATYKMDSGSFTSITSADGTVKRTDQPLDTYHLTFNNKESVYKKDAQLEKPKNDAMASLGISVISGGENDLLYKNIKEQRFTKKNRNGEIILN